ncbi:MAG: mechanosensitive ion channel family protein [Actinomycetota bacterium]
MLAQQDTLTDSVERLVTNEQWLAIGISLLVAAVLTVVAQLIVRRLRHRMERVEGDSNRDVAIRRAGTVGHGLSSVIVAVIWFIAALMILSALGVNLAPLLASAGVAGVALGFGAQSVVRDGLTGFFILVENQFGVGDVVAIQTAAGLLEGTVEDLSMRTTRVRAYDGTIHTVPNGNMVFVSNKSRGWARAIVDLRVAYGEDTEKLREILEELFTELHDDPAFGDALMSGPEVLGIQALGETGVVVRVVAQTLPSRRWAIERLLRERVSTRLEERGVQVPMQQGMVRVPGAEGGTPP